MSYEELYDTAFEEAMILSGGDVEFSENFATDSAAIAELEIAELNGEAS